MIETLACTVTGSVCLYAGGVRTMQLRIGSRRVTQVCVGAVLLIAGGSARAADEEIQVYMNEINAPGQPGLDLHVNDVATGDGTPDYPGAQSSLHRVRVTPEFSYSLDDHFELGAYLPLTTIDASGRFRVDGWKLRVKWLARHPERGFYYGVNYEVGRVDYRLDQNPWNNEIKLIAGWEGDHWIIGTNTNIDFALSGPAKGPASVQLATKLGYKLAKETTFGIESYNGIGTLRDFGNFSGSEHSTFVALDTRLGRWDLNAGIGKGYGTARDSLIVKFIIGVPIGK
jgi:hypothetical protein